MPSSTPKQQRAMAACAHGAKLDVCERIPKEVAVEFSHADQRRTHMRHGYAKLPKKNGGM